MISKACFTKKRLIGGLIFLALFIFGLFFFRARSLEVRPVSLIFAGQEEGLNELPFNRPDAPAGEYEIKIDLYSASEQSRLFHFKGDQVIKEAMLNGGSLDLEAIKSNFNQEEFKDFYVPLSLDQGNNLFTVKLDHDGSRPLIFNAHPRLSLLEIICGFFCFALLPLIVIAQLFFLALDFINKQENPLRWLDYPRLILGLGIALRVLYVLLYGFQSYNHDHYFHLDYINYLTDHFQLPPVDKGAEFAQQPLYYVLAASLLALLRTSGVSGDWSWYGLVALSCLFSVLFIIYAYRFIKIATKDQLVQSLFLSFLALTPTMLFPAGRISNDTLAILLGMMSAYYITAYYRQATLRRFLLASLITWLAFLTKITAGLWIPIWILVLLSKYLKIKKDQTSSRDQANFQRKMILGFSLVILFTIGITFWRAYIPTDQKFRFVTSTAFQQQTITNPNLYHLLGFDLSELIRRGRSMVYDGEKSFFVYQYGTLMFGEYEYDALFKYQPWGKALMQLIYLLGLAYVAGIIAFLFNFSRRSFLFKLLALAAFINFILVFHFMLFFPSVCNTDFRYYAPTFSVFALMYALGIRYLLNFFDRYPIARRLRIPQKILGWNVILFLALTIWLIWMLILRAPNTIT